MNNLSYEDTPDLLNKVFLRKHGIVSNKFYEPGSTDWSVVLEWAYWDGTKNEHGHYKDIVIKEIRELFSVYEYALKFFKEHLFDEVELPVVE